MRTRFQRFARAGLSACVLGVVGCDERSPGAAAQEPIPHVSDHTLAGAWRWVASEREGEVVRPAGPADGLVLELGRLGTYREHRSGSVLRGHYAFARGQLFHLQDTSFVVLMMDSSRFFPISGRYSPAIAIRSFRGDTLVFSGTGTDATLYTFVHTEGPE
jgi:hypothetical protein